jgi:hypothetical protein
VDFIPWTRSHLSTDADRAKGGQMRRTTALAAVTATVLLFSACTVGSGEVVTETRSVSGFDEIDLRGTGEVRVTVDGTESLRIEAEDNIIDRLTSDVRGTTLVLGTDRPIRPTEDVIYTVTMVSLEGVEISGSGAITVGEFATEDFSVDVNGSGAATIDDLSAETVFVRISGSGAVTIGGDGEELDLSISGSGAFDGSRLETSIGDVDISGSGSATVNVSETLDVGVSGSGNVEYLGNPSLTVDSSGSGTVSQR